MKLLTQILSIISCITASVIQSPYDTEYFSTQTTRGYWFQPYTDMYATGARIPTEQPGRVVFDLVYINGPPSTFPDMTKATSLYHYSKQGENTSWPTTICIQPYVFLSANAYYGVLGGRVVKESTGNVSFAYGQVNEYNVAVGSNVITIKRLMSQDSIFLPNQPTVNVSTDDDNPYASITLFFETTYPSITPNFCQNWPIDPDNPGSSSQENQLQESSASEQNNFFN